MLLASSPLETTLVIIEPVGTTHWPQVPRADTRTVLGQLLDVPVYVHQAYQIPFWDADMCVVDRDDVPTLRMSLPLPTTPLGQQALRLSSPRTKLPDLTSKALPRSSEHLSRLPSLRGKALNALPHVGLCDRPRGITHEIRYSCAPGGRIQYTQSPPGGESRCLH